MKSICFFSTALLLPGAMFAQSDIPLLRPEERRVVDDQRTELYSAITPAITTAAKSTVRVWVGPRRVAYGTVVGEGGEVLTKWSELGQGKGDLTIQAADGEQRAATLKGVYAEDDLALLSLDGDPLTPVTWSFEEPGLGKFLAAPHPEGLPASFGVVSVLERNLRDSDQAYLGIWGTPGFAGPGVKVDKVEPDSGAAAAGLKPGDVILQVGERPISGLLELKNALNPLDPGSTVRLQVEANGDRKEFEVLLGKGGKARQMPGGARLQQMERMGGAISRVRDSFSRVIQTDMPSKPNQIGGPVVDLQGRVVGITVARADRTRSFLMPAAAVVELLKEKAGDPELAKVEPEEMEPQVRQRVLPPAPQARPLPGGEESLRRHLGEMQRLMNLMDDEIAEMEGSR